MLLRLKKNLLLVTTSGKKILSSPDPPRSPIRLVPLPESQKKKTKKQNSS